MEEIICEMIQLQMWNQVLKAMILAVIIAILAIA